MKKDREDPRWRVDRLLVGDVGAASLSEQFWPVMSASQGQPRRIHVTGWRAMDRLYGLDREEAETEIRDGLGMTDRSMPIMLCSGQLTCTSVVTREAVQAIQEADQLFRKLEELIKTAFEE